MDRRYARSILEEFEKANVHLRRGIRLHELPRNLNREIQRISSMESFEEEFHSCLERYQLPLLTSHRSDGWVHFLHLYARVIEDCPLTAKAEAAGTIERVTVQVEMARETTKHEGGEDMFYKVRWLIRKRGGETGELFVINSFSLEGLRPNQMD